MIQARFILLGAGPFVLALLLAFSGVNIASAKEPGVEAAQRRLAEIGFDSGPEDGLMGPRTRKAIKAFQETNNLRGTGRLDAKTLNALFPTNPPSGSSKIGGKLLSYEKLGWRDPQSGADALSRFHRQAGSPNMKRSANELIVPDGESVYVIASGDGIPGFDCDPAKGRVEMEFMLGPGGPVVFRPLDRTGYCQLGFGILLKVGQRLRMSAASWEGGAMPDGVVEVGTKGLIYLESNQ